MWVLPVLDWFVNMPEARVCTAPTAAHIFHTKLSFLDEAQAITLSHLFSFRKMSMSGATPAAGGKWAGVLFALTLVAFVVESQLTQVKRISIHLHVCLTFFCIVCPG